MERYVKLRIPFATKSLIKNKAGHRMKGVAFYIFDLINQYYVDEYIEIINTNFRLTDKAMIKPTSYYEDNIVRSFRDNFLDKYSNIDPNTINDMQYIELSKNQIIEVNEYIKKLKTTNRTMFSFFSGSRFTGAETKNTATQMVCINPNYFGCNFANVINNYKCSKLNKLKKDWDDLRVVELDDMVKNELINGFSALFYKYNKDFEYRENLPDNILDEEDIVNYQKIEYKNNVFKFKDNQIMFIESFLNRTLDKYEEYSNNKTKLGQKLHSFYTSNILSCIKQKLIPLHHTIQKNNLSQVTNAHIISKSELIKQGTKKSFEDVINPFNCLRIDQSYHKMWDDHIIEFDRNGNILKNGKILKENYLDIDTINNNPKTLDYFEKYLKSSIKRLQNIK